MFCKKEITGHFANRVNDMSEEMLESDLELLGVTGLEDCLCEGVKECISDFKKAAINLWVVTGDTDSSSYNTSLATGIIDEKTMRTFRILGEKV